ncbi:tetratricopeptide repeat-containing diguanylate cyclase [Shewanella acanthi]|uniref:tetratricopeptide repeat-containing diguanylate cyclase n=1 Tax=Shewanella acanthi TaxID=2864212 RepID=UPI001C657D77|nr:GGDEF domain-containing protein [Shewanella acanthi]QYJ80646.1 GGDEF domain-containing protein [Shewanella acanthi]
MPLVAATVDYDVALNEIAKLQYTDLSAVAAKLPVLEADFEHMTHQQQGRFLIFKGASLTFNGKYQEAIETLRRVELLVHDVDLLFSAYNYLATANVAQRNFKDAFDALAKSLALIERIENVNFKRTSYIRIAGLYIAMGATEDVGIYASKALSLATEKDTKDICFAKLYLAVHSLEFKNFAIAFDEFQSTRTYCDSVEVPLVANIALKGMGESKLKLMQPSEAIPYLLDALKKYELFKYQLEINSVHALLAEAYLGIKDLQKANEHAQFVMGLADEPSTTEHKYKATRVMAQLSAQRNDYQQAYEYSNKEQGYNQQILDEAKIKNLAYQSAKFNADEQIREINLLNKERELYIAQQTVKEREYTNMLMFITILVGGIFFLGILLVVGTLQKRKFMRMAKIDALTGVLNRGAGQDLGENLFVQVAARGGDFCVILFDLDYFKQINDSFGHGTGDWALKKVAESLKSCIRNGDVLARIGGEEFAIFLPYANVEKGREVAELCRTKIAAIDTHLSGHQFNITASFGVSGLKQDDLSLDPLLHRADMALYAAKSSGRNTVCCYAETMVSSKRATNINKPLVNQPAVESTKAL